MGFETITFARMNDEERAHRISKKLLQFIWKPDFEGVDGNPVPSQHSIFANMLAKHYEPSCGI
jgi:hypothetical protein